MLTRDEKYITQLRRPTLVTRKMSKSHLILNDPHSLIKVVINHFLKVFQALI